MTHEEIINKLSARFGVEGFTTSEFRDNRRIIAPAERVYGVLEFLKQQCGFDLLAELGGADYLHYPDASDRDSISTKVKPSGDYPTFSMERPSISSGKHFSAIPVRQHHGRYGVWYVLVDTTTGRRLIVKTYADDPLPTVPSVFALWKGADWMEREVYDMYGVLFDGHPDLRRILLPDEFTAFPLRKDYPMRGQGERHNFPVITRAES